MFALEKRECGGHSDKLSKLYRNGIYRDSLFSPRHLLRRTSARLNSKMQMIETYPHASLTESNCVLFTPPHITHRTESGRGSVRMERCRQRRQRQRRSRPQLVQLGIVSGCNCRRSSISIGQRRPTSNVARHWQQQSATASAQQQYQQPEQQSHTHFNAGNAVACGRLTVCRSARRCGRCDAEHLCDVIDDAVIGAGGGHNAAGGRRSGPESHTGPGALDERRDGRTHDVQFASRSDRWHALHVERWRHGRECYVFVSFLIGENVGWLAECPVVSVRKRGD